MIINAKFRKSKFRKHSDEKSEKSRIAISFVNSYTKLAKI